MKELKRLVFVLVIAVFFIGLFKLCDSYAYDITQEYASQISAPLVTGSNTAVTSGTSGAAGTAEDVDVQNMVEDLVRSDYTADIRLSAMGDILIQSQQMEYAYSSSGFDFTDSFVYLSEMISDSDFSIATLKTTMAGSGRGASSEHHGYGTDNSMYNSPEILADNMADAGIGLVNVATNHALDSGYNGLMSTLKFLDGADIAYVGARKDRDDTNHVSMNINGMQVGFVGYTNLTNGLELDEDDSYALNTLDNYSERKINTLCAQIRDMVYDNEVIVVMLNFGSIESDSIESSQASVAQRLADAGADLILGTGSRVMKPIDVLESSVSHTGQCVVLYGMGAVLSSEGYILARKDVDISAVFDFNFIKSEMGIITLKEMCVRPVYLNWYDSKIQAVPVMEAANTDHFEAELDEDDMERINHSAEETLSHLLSASDLEAVYNEDDYTYHISFVSDTDAETIESETEAEESETE